jgi:hypothetical protein
MKKNIFFRVVFPEMAFASRDFNTDKEAFNFREDHIKGFPKNADMTKENREYWKNQGKGIKVYKVTENLKEIKRK